ncbi:uncharacterized protein K460DRAFT_361214 [Cucurbitaria berberidis CBS 394.84]|uniref:Uncharacterized protein n=1 Tax=Cucurbitaria berberidis CBS 394.84 TaxID=1168544 RepID=A0A9P4GPQ8_9PLEO|nr:uncharacterized protein K460DRAFT_361214 [Cucurbitaria berberidis CBS 394.84]KAF1850413.1 hypothetical protein K460DRAFT_361214 [Cucurbitaria berberidis CBS 394.84]
MTSEFFSNASSTFAGYDITDDQINTLKGCLEGIITTTEAARKLTAHPEASSTPVELKQRLGGLWTLLNDTAVALPSAQPDILSVLQKIRTLPKAEEPKGEGEEYIELDDGFFWRELTDWANNWADAFNSHAAQFLIEKHADDQKKAQRKAAWTSACAYTARLAATGDDALSSYGGGLDRASRAIAEALEVDTGDKEPDSLEAAANLFLYASSELYHRCKEGRTDGMLTSTAGVWQGEEGFSEARWRFWTERWTALAGLPGISEHARAVARQALEAMKRVEGTGS